MSLLIQRSEQFQFNGLNIRSCYLKEHGQCLIARDVYRALGYTREGGIHAIQRLVPNEYKLRFGDAKIDFKKVPKNDRLHPDSVLLTEPGVYCFLLRCKRPAAKPFMTWVVKTVLPREVRRLNGQLKDKDSTIALLNDDLKTLNEQLEVQDSAIALLNDELETTQQQVLTLQRRIDQLERRVVPYLKDQKNNNGMVIIQKNNGDTYPYVAICGQQGYIAQKLQNKLSDYPNGEIVVLAETPNAIVHYNWLREQGYIEINPSRTRHFKLGNNYTHQRLMELEA